MSKPDIITEEFHGSDEHGSWQGIKLLIGDDFYIDIGCREGVGAMKKAKVIGHEVQAAITQLISIRAGKK